MTTTTRIISLITLAILSACGGQDDQSVDLLARIDEAETQRKTAVQTREAEIVQIETQVAEEKQQSEAALVDVLPLTAPPVSALPEPVVKTEPSSVAITDQILIDTAELDGELQVQHALIVEVEQSLRDELQLVRRENNLRGDQLAVLQNQIASLEALVVQSQQQTALSSIAPHEVLPPLPEEVYEEDTLWRHELNSLVTDIEALSTIAERFNTAMRNAGQSLPMLKEVSDVFPAIQDRVDTISDVVEEYEPESHEVITPESEAYNPPAEISLVWAKPDAILVHVDDVPYELTLNRTVETPRGSLRVRSIGFPTGDVRLQLGDEYRTLTIE